MSMAIPMNAGQEADIILNAVKYLSAPGNTPLQRLLAAIGMDAETCERSPLGVMAAMAVVAAVAASVPSHIFVTESQLCDAGLKALRNW